MGRPKPKQDEPGAAAPSPRKWPQQKDEAAGASAPSPRKRSQQKDDAAGASAPSPRKRAQQKDEPGAPAAPSPRRRSRQRARASRERAAKRREACPVYFRTANNHGLSSHGCGEGDTLVNQADEDAWFKTAHGTDAGVYSFESVKNPGLFLSAKGQTVSLQRADGQSEFFREVKPLNGASGFVSLESVALPKQVVTQSNGKVCCQDPKNALQRIAFLFNADASWTMAEAQDELESPVLSPRQRAKAAKAQKADVSREKDEPGWPVLSPRERALQYADTLREKAAKHNVSPKAEKHSAPPQADKRSASPSAKVTPPGRSPRRCRSPRSPPRSPRSPPRSRVGSPVQNHAAGPPHTVFMGNPWPLSPDDTRPTSSGWCIHHHVTSSRGNTALPRLRRAYFDHPTKLDPWYQEPGGRALTAYSQRNMEARPLHLEPLPARNGDTGNDAEASPAVKAEADLSIPNPFLPTALDVGVLLEAIKQQKDSQGGGGRGSSGGRKALEAEKSGGRRVSVGKKVKKVFVRTAMAECVTAPAFAQFAQWCEVNHGNIMNVWRILDKDRSMMVSKNEFTNGLKGLGYKGDAKALWAVLNRDHTNIISFIHYIPEVAFDLAIFKMWAKTRFGSVVSTFHAIDKDRSGKVTFDEFSHGLIKEGIPNSLRDCLRMLFTTMNDGTSLKDRGREALGVLVTDEVVFLDTWQLPEYFWMEGDPGSMAAFRRAVMQRSLWNPLIGWRRFFDKDGSMKVNYGEFVTACKKLASNGVPEASPPQGFPLLYRSLDRCCAGWISLRHWDQEAYRLLSKFTIWARDTFGRVSRIAPAWEKTKDKGVGFSAFKRGVQDLGFSSKEVQVLFEGLSMEKVEVDDILDSVHGGKISQAELVFLEHWEVEKQLEEEETWERIAQVKLPHLASARLAN